MSSSDPTNDNSAFKLVPDQIAEAAEILMEEAAEPVVEDEGRYLALVRFFCRHYSLTFAKAAVEKGIPDDYENMDRAVLPRLLEVVGLKSEFVLRKAREIDPIVLPCVAFRKNGSPVLIVKIDEAARTATIVDFDDGNFQQEIKLRSLARKVTDDVLLVTPSADATATRMDKAMLAKDTSRGHWFWKPVRENWGSWFQIMMAALGINIFGLALPIFVMNVYDRVIPNLALVTLWTLAIGVAIAFALDLVLKVIRSNVLEIAGRRIDLKVAASLFRHAMNIKLLYRRGGAAGIASQIRDFESVRDFFTSSSFVAVIDLMFIGIFVFVLWIIVGPIAIVPLLAVPLVMIIALIAQVPIGRSIERAQQMASKRHLILIESLSGIETVKSVNGEPVMQREWENAVAASSRISGKSKFWSNFAINSTMLIQQGVSVVILLWGVYLVSDGRISVGGLIAANILAGRVLAPLGNICQTLVRAQQAFKSMSTISEYMDLPVESPPGVRSELAVEEGAVEFQNVTFTYPESKVAALSGVSTTFEKGKSVGILGRVGSGKTTFGKMLVGLVQPDEGLILIDGHEVQQYDTSMLREGIGYLPQDPELFTGTIRENLILGRPHASDEEINRALYYSGMDYFIAENPEGLNQFVGEKGNRLSGGQRQAISLARLLLRKPKVLFLDEPTNAMDTATEATVIRRLKELQSEGVSLIISTHRHSLAAIVDRLLVLNNGKIVADGPREAVLASLSGKKPVGVKKGAA